MRGPSQLDELGVGTGQQTAPIGRVMVVPKYNRPPVDPIIQGTTGRPGGGRGGARHGVLEDIKLWATPKFHSQPASYAMPIAELEQVGLERLPHLWVSE